MKDIEVRKYYKGKLFFGGTWKLQRAVCLEASQCIKKWIRVLQPQIGLSSEISTSLEKIEAFRPPFSQ